MRHARSLIPIVGLALCGAVWGDETARQVARAVDSCEEALVVVSFSATVTNPFAGFMGRNRGRERDQGGGRRPGRGGEDGGSREQVEDSGTGVILDREGHVLAAHFDPPSFGGMVGSMQARMEEISIRMPDGATVEAQLLGQDPVTRLAILKFDPAGLTFTPLRVGSGASCVLGDQVIVVGRLPASLGSGPTFRLTRVNGQVGDVLLTQESVDDMIAAPVFATSGELVGFVGAYRDDQEPEQRGFNMRSVMRVLQGRGGGEFTARGVVITVATMRDLLEAPGSVSEATGRAWHGLEVTPVSDQYRSFYGGLEDYPGCVTVARVVAGSPAAEAGVREADILLKVEDEVIDSRAVGGFEQLFATRQPGEQVKLQGLRDGEPISFTLALATAPATWADAPTHRDDALGLTVKQITADYVEERRLQAGQQGVVVVALTEEGVAARAGLREGDILVSASGRPLESLSVFQRALAAGGNLDVEYLRGGSRGTTTLER